MCVTRCTTPTVCGTNSNKLFLGVTIFLWDLDECVFLFYFYFSLHFFCCFFFSFFFCLLLALVFSLPISLACTPKQILFFSEKHCVSTTIFSIKFHIHAHSNMKHQTLAQDLPPQQHNF